MISSSYELAKAIAVNAFLGNSLTEVNLKSSFYAGYGLLENQFFQYMNLSEKEIAEY